MKSTRYGHFFYTSSLFFLIFLTAVCIALSAADVIVQALFDRTESGPFDLRNLFVVAASYVVLKVYSHIQGQFDDVKKVRKSAEPRPEDIGHVGWGKPGDAQFEGVDFKRVVARTPMFIEQAAMKISLDFARPSHVPTRKYIHFLIQRGLIDGQIGQVYVDGYEQARFSRVPVNQDTFREIMTHLAVILKHLGYPPQNPAAAASGSRQEDGSSSVSSGSGSTSHYHPLQRRKSSGDPLSSVQTSRSPRDDDVASLAQSIATWTSRSTSNTHDDDQDDGDDENHYDYDQHIREVIFSRLMMDR
ncbi:hypothetical protein BDB00DRAFT_753060 [Zychaea mexicana]|uniref:uncharacterized protein n=1 Tax=Zychaea mexicana TaxID=64656 RepID=UPI0022FE1E8A|nr:uncharacterized protein BDB00DRAFT_753060 [Zychaea mexicana]KAI9499536.1 hypothetical protein BDB00DRAFT_753060 [Zychaea mexicana]